MVVLIKTALKSISLLLNKKYPKTLSPEDELVIENKDMYWVCWKKFVEGSVNFVVYDHDHLSNLTLSGGSNCQGVTKILLM